jgi:hypothetical protein
MISERLTVLVIGKFCICEEHDIALGITVKLYNVSDIEVLTTMNEITHIPVSFC